MNRTQYAGSVESAGPANELNSEYRDVTSTADR